MTARRLDGWLQVGGLRVQLYSIDGRPWLLAADLERLLKRDVGKLTAPYRALLTAQYTTLTTLEGKGHKRRFFSVGGTKLLAAMTPTKTGQDLFNLLCMFRMDAPKKNTKRPVRND